MAMPASEHASDRAPAFPRAMAVDLLVALLLALGVAALVTAREATLPQALFDKSAVPAGTVWHFKDVWFDADLSNVYAMMRSTGTDAHRITAEHPLLSVTLYVPVRVLMKVGALDPAHAARVCMALVAGLWTLTLYALLRQLGCRRADTVVIALLGASSAAAAFWFTVPEVFAFGGLSLLVCLVLDTQARRVGSSGLAVVASAVSLSVTVTNWMTGLLASHLFRPWRRALGLSIGALALVSLVWVAQKQVFPASQPFIGSARVRAFVYRPVPSRVLRVSSVLVSDTVVMPRIDGLQAEQGHALSVQTSRVGSSGWMGAVATFAWLALFALGVADVATAWWTRGPDTWTLVALAVAGQLALHAMFGRETFLYAAQMLPLCVLVAARATLGSRRRLALALAVVVVVLGGANNQQQFASAAASMHLRMAPLVPAGPQ